MIDPHINNPKSIKYYVRRYLQSIKEELIGKTVIDLPAGTGATAEILVALGAQVEAFDLFPEYFLLDGVSCKRADIMNGIPVPDEHADMLICQEGIEHFSNQLKALKAFNRALKPGGQLLITTPSYSNLAAKLSYVLFESETNKKMPPNELDDIWMSDKSITPEIYHGHIFLIGLQKLRLLAKLSGFRIQDIRFVRFSKRSLFLFPLFYPFILLRSALTYYRHLRKPKGIPKTAKRAVYHEQYRININPRHLVNKHLFIIFEKEKNVQDVDFSKEAQIKQFGKIM